MQFTYPQNVRPASDDALIVRAAAGLFTSAEREQLQAWEKEIIEIYSKRLAIEDETLWNQRAAAIRRQPDATPLDKAYRQMDLEKEKAASAKVSSFLQAAELEIHLRFKPFAHRLFLALAKLVRERLAAVEMQPVEDELLQLDPAIYERWRVLPIRALLSQVEGHVAQFAGASDIGADGALAHLQRAGVVGKTPLAEPQLDEVPFEDLGDGGGVVSVDVAEPSHQGGMNHPATADLVSLEPGVERGEIPRQIYG